MLARLKWKKAAGQDGDILQDLASASIEIFKQRLPYLTYM